MSPSKQHGRTAAHRRAEQQATRAAARRKQRRMRAIVVGAVGAVVVVAIIGATIGAGGDDDDASGADERFATSTTEPADEATVTIADTASSDEKFPFGTGECAPDRKPAEVPTSFPDSFRNCLTTGASYKAVVGTSEGTFTIDLLPERAPGAVNNFVQLARWGWFDGVTFHRIVPGFVNQTGDRTGDPPGTGGPGYSFPDELPSSVDEYTPGAVAMANSGADTNGSQWFTCIDCSRLPTPGYSLFGFVSDGMDVVRAINDVGTGDRSPPEREVKIVAVEILEDPLDEDSDAFTGGD